VLVAHGAASDLDELDERPSSATENAVDFLSEKLKLPTSAREW
jgi:hypothetical protein